MLYILDKFTEVKGGARC